MTFAMPRRIVVEKRAFALPIAIGFLVNVAVYAFVVGPLRARVAGAAARADAAAQIHRAAERDHVAARATVSGKDRAARALDQFYRDVLPADLASARRITSRLAQLARDADLRYERRMLEPQHDKDSRLSKLRMTMELEGEYENVRRFIYQLETASDFVVIEDVKLAQGRESGQPLTLTVALSTYFRSGSEAGRAEPGTPALRKGA